MDGATEAGRVLVAGRPLQQPVLLIHAVRGLHFRGQAFSIANSTTGT